MVLQVILPKTSSFDRKLIYTQLRYITRKFNQTIHRKQKMEKLTQKKGGYPRNQIRDYR